MNETQALIIAILGVVGFFICLIGITLFINHKVNKETEEENKEEHHNNIHKRNWNTYD